MAKKDTAKGGKRPKTKSERKRSRKKKKQHKKAVKRGRHAMRRKWYRVDKPLHDVIQRWNAPRRIINILVWDYIRKHKLQDPTDRRYIIPDKKLGKIIPPDHRTSMLRLSTYIHKHIIFDKDKKEKEAKKKAAKTAKKAGAASTKKQAKSKKETAKGSKAKKG